MYDASTLIVLVLAAAVLASAAAVILVPRSTKIALSPLKRRQFVFLIIAQTMLLRADLLQNPADILAEMAMFPVEALPEDVADLHSWADSWVSYATYRSQGPPPYRREPPEWFKEEWISKDW